MRASVFVEQPNAGLVPLGAGQEQGRFDRPGGRPASARQIEQPRPFECNLRKRSVSCGYPSHASSSEAGS